MITIDAENIPKIREWLATRGGVRRWSNQEIASGHPREVFTPADSESAGWRYRSVDVTTDPAQIMVRTSEVLATFRGRFKAYYFGPGVAPASERKADRMVAKYNDPAVVWTWVYDDPGYVRISIVRETLRPLDLQADAAAVESV